MIEETLFETEERMEKAVAAVVSEFAKIRTGKASPHILNGITVDYYGTMTPLNQTAQIGAPDHHLLTVQPWEKTMLKEIEKAILKSDLGLNPQNDGNIIRIPIPALTEERRKELVKLVKKHGEDGKIAIRNIRREANENLKKSEKNKDISEDERDNTLIDVQEMTDKYIKKVDEVVESKSNEVLEV